jgi:hypothetical protein
MLHKPSAVFSFEYRNTPDSKDSPSAGEKQGNIEKREPSGALLLSITLYLAAS